MVTNDTGTVLWSWNSDAFGTTQQNLDVDGDNANFPFILRFPGQLFDPESNNHYNYFRDYEPGMGRYLESDPIGLEGGENTYNYVSNNPLKFLDFLGLWRTTIDVCIQRHGYRRCGLAPPRPIPVPIIPPLPMCDAEKDRCTEVKKECIKDCIFELPSWDGLAWDFQKCLNRCMELNGCR